MENNTLWDEAKDLFNSKEYAKAIPLLEQLSEGGMAEAQNLLASCYYFGKGAEPDVKKAFGLYSKAAEQGFQIAQYNLAFCYYEGEGVKQDIAKAVELWRKAAEDRKEPNSVEDEDGGITVICGYPLAQFALGMCYDAGEGVEQDFYQASEWLWEAAEQGYSLAFTQLGLYYEKGILIDEDDLRSVPEDKAKEAMQRKAAGLYRKAAEGGHDEAQFYLGDCYLNGRGVEQDKKQAAEWFKKAADQGYLQAKEALENLDD
jgi:TPR repeat protein